jgi:hypothetical protein
MALPASGQISTSDINTELGRTSNLEFKFSQAAVGSYATINTSSPSYPDSVVPHRVSEWFSYDHSYAAYTNSHYYLNDTLGDCLVMSATTSPFNLSGTQDLTISMWVRQDQTTAANQILWDLQNAAGATTASTANRFFLQYIASLNRFVVRHRTNSVNYDRQFSLHDNNSATGTGTSSSNTWTASNRGNVNADGWCLLTVVYDASQTDATNGLKLYWNATELTSEAASSDGSRSTSAVNYIALGNNAHNYSTTAGAFDGAFDEVKIYTAALSAGDVTTIYNSGTIVDAANSMDTNLRTEFTFDANQYDSNGDFPTTLNNDGTRTSW